LRVAAIPNPGFGEVILRIFSTPSHAVRAARVDVVDAHGRSVRTIVTPLGPDASEIVWDGTDEAGRAVPAGAYYARVTLDDHTSTVRLVRVSR
jgi:hypothetical protein